MSCGPPRTRCRRPNTPRRVAGQQPHVAAEGELERIEVAAQSRRRARARPRSRRCWSAAAARRRRAAPPSPDWSAMGRSMFTVRRSTEARRSGGAGLAADDLAVAELLVPRQPPQHERILGVIAEEHDVGCGAPCRCERTGLEHPVAGGCGLEPVEREAFGSRPGSCASACRALLAEQAQRRRERGRRMGPVYRPAKTRSPLARRNSKHRVSTRGNGGGNSTFHEVFGRRPADRASSGAAPAARGRGVLRWITARPEPASEFPARKVRPDGVVSPRCESAGVTSHGRVAPKRQR